MNWYELDPLVCLAPMEHYSDSPFRQIVREVAPHVPVFTEFISVDGLKHNPEKVSKKYRFNEAENPFIVQLFGGDPDHFVNAVKMLEAHNIAGIDINMGCPAHQVVKCQFGAALIQNQDRAFRIAEACVKASKVPISVKTRLGWTDEEDILTFGKGFEECGVKAITVHGRTYKQAFSGDANWEPIYELKRRVKTMKVIGNGDINSGQFALDKINNLDGVMVGHHSFGNPWLLQEVYLSLKNGKHTPINPPLEERIPFILKHVSLALDYKEDERRTMIEMRKHLGSYMRAVHAGKDVRGKLVRVEKPEEVPAILDEFMKSKT